MGGAGGEGGWLKMLLKNTCEGVHLIVKLPAISFKLLFIVLFLGIISWVFHISVVCVWEGGELFFRWGGLYWGSTPWGRIGFDVGGGFEKNYRMGCVCPTCPPPSTMGNPAPS